MNKKQAEAITKTLEDMAEYEYTIDAAVDDSDYYDFLTDCGFEANDYVGQWLGPDGSGLEAVSDPATEMRDAWAAWLKNKKAPTFGCRICLNELLYANDIEGVNFS